MPAVAQPLAFSPGSITCFFYLHRGSTAAETFSRGCAINIAQGVHAAIVPSDRHALLMNDRAIDLPTADRVVRQLAPKPVEIRLQTDLPIGCGFGLSASSTLAAAFAVNQFFELGQSRRQLGLAAHVAEVECRTGVGDVAAQLCGGVVYRRCRQSPFDCFRLQFKQEPLQFAVFGPLSTSEVLKSDATVAAIARQGPRACEWLESQCALPDDVPEVSNPAATCSQGLTLATILQRSSEFAEDSGLLTSELRDTIQSVKQSGGAATMILLGRSVVATAAINRDPSIWISTEVDEQGTRILR